MRFWKIFFPERRKKRENEEGILHRMKESVLPSFYENPYGAAQLSLPTLPYLSTWTSFRHLLTFPPSIVFIMLNFCENPKIFCHFLLPSVTYGDPTELEDLEMKNVALILFAVSYFTNSQIFEFSRQKLVLFHWSPGGCSIHAFCCFGCSKANCTWQICPFTKSSWILLLSIRISFSRMDHTAIQSCQKSPNLYR